MKAYQLQKLINKITKNNFENKSFYYYNSKINVQSGSYDFQNVTIEDKDKCQEIYSFDFLTKRLIYKYSSSEETKNIIINEYKELYNNIKIFDETKNEL